MSTHERRATLVAKATAPIASIAHSIGPEQAAASPFTDYVRGVTGTGVPIGVAIVNWP